MSTAEDPYRVSMVCLGNICRSPIAEVVLREMVEQEGLDVVVTSAGTSSWHVGGPMDPGSAAVLADLQEMVGDRRRPRVVLLRDSDPDGDADQSVPDPYGGGPEGFATVYAQVEAACAGLVARLPELMADR